VTYNEPSITVGIATLDRYPYVETLLDDLAIQTRLPDEVLIVDQTAPHRRKNLPVERWKHAFPLRIVVQNEKGTTKARNLLLRECRSDIILKPDDDVRLEPTYVENHARHFADRRVDVVNGPVYEWDAMKREWYVKWKGHLMLGGAKGSAFMSTRAYSGGNSSVRVASALAIGGWDENIVTYGEDDDFSDRLDLAGALCVFDPQAGLRHLRAPEGGERDKEWGGCIGPEGNWDVLAGFFYFSLVNSPLYRAFSLILNYVLRPFRHIRHGRAVGLRLLAQVLVALPVSLWRWCRGPLLIDSGTQDWRTRRFTKKEVSQQIGKLALNEHSVARPDVKPPGRL
jgi:hypothetical protein